MRTFVLDGMERAADIEKGDLYSAEHDTGSRPGRKFIRTNGFHLGILGGSARFAGKTAARRPESRDEGVGRTRDRGRTRP
jgi:hypothetical protein